MKKPSRYLKTIASLLTVGLVLTESLIATASIKPTAPSPSQQTSVENLLAQLRRSRLGFRIPGIRSSRQRTGAISRGPRACGQETIDVTAILPKTNEAKLAGKKEIEIESTVTQSPTFLIYISETKKTKATFTVVRDGEDQPPQEHTLELPGTPGVVSVTVDLPKDEGENSESASDQSEPPLYHWFFTIDCNPNDSDTSGDLMVDGWIKLIPKDEDMTKDLAQAQESDRPGIYAKYGNWTETLSTLAQLRLESPNNQQFKDDWRSLLASVGLSRIANKDLVGPLKEMED